jgi:hypothetical protein
LRRPEALDRLSLGLINREPVGDGLLGSGPQVVLGLGEDALATRRLLTEVSVEHAQVRLDEREAGLGHAIRPRRRPRRP